jgi:uncharacterized membrane protein YfhO
VRLHHPGIVILADAYYPGWRLTINGRPAPILRANQMMRGAAVSAGEHQLVYRYDPWSFRIGAGVSSVGVTVLLLMIARRYGSCGLWRISRAAGRLIANSPSTSR